MRTQNLFLEVSMVLIMLATIFASAQIVRADEPAPQASPVPAAPAANDADEAKRPRARPMLSLLYGPSALSTSGQTSNRTSMLAQIDLLQVKKGMFGLFVILSPKSETLLSTSVTSNTVFYGIAAFGPIAKDGVIGKGAYFGGRLGMASTSVSGLGSNNPPSSSKFTGGFAIGYDLPIVDSFRFNFEASLMTIFSKPTTSYLHGMGGLKVAF